MLINKATLPLAWALRQVGKRVRLRGWDRLLRALFHPDRQRQFAFRIPFIGFTYPAYADNFIDWNALFYGSYEKFELRLLAALAVTLLNPHVYLDTILLIGSLGAQQPEPAAYTLGAASASTIWFLILALGGAWLAPWLARPLTWRLIDLGVATMMFTVAAQLVVLA